jgi:hypothetical protein
MVKEIASFRFRNGRFGINTASISRVPASTYLPARYSVNTGNGGDAFAVHCPIEAKAMYRRALAGKEAAPARWYY